MASDRQTDIAVLGALSVEPMSGYALRQAIRDVLGHFWSESFGQIYPTLAELRAEGLVEVTRDEADSKSKFAITERGLEHLRARLSEPPQSARPRNGTLLRLFFGRHLGLDGCRDLLELAGTQAVEQLAGFDAIRREIGAEEPTDDHPFFLLTVSAGEHAARATQAWAEESLLVLAGIENQS
jgi:DNA-binding PadR family transcriptional regulator